jgi:hypothetical protein
VSGSTGERSGSVNLPQYFAITTQFAHAVDVLDERLLKNAALGPIRTREESPFARVLSKKFQYVLFA